MDDFDFYGEADTWCTVFLLPALESTAFYFKLLPILVKNKAKNFMEKKKNLQKAMFPEWPFLEITVFCNHDS